MDIKEPTGVYTREVIMEYMTDGVDHWNLTRKEELIRCKDCKRWKRNPDDGYGYCKGFRKYEDGYCDEFQLQI